MSERLRVLVVSYFFPPDPAVGGLRTAKFVKYLPEFGWEPTVLTARTVDAAETEHGIHATPFASPWKLLRRSTSGRRSDRPAAPSLSAMAVRGPLRRRAYSALRHILPMSSVRMPDATLGWVPYAVSEGKRLLGMSDFDAILSSSGPPSSHIVAARLQRASGLPWIADYRDLWSDNHWDTRVSPFRTAERLLERKVLRRAALLTSVGPVWAQRLAAVHDKPTEVIYNGFDPADYPTASPPDDEFSLTYVGSLYYPDQNPEPLLEALVLLKGKGILDAQRFTIRFLGTEPGPLSRRFQHYGVEQWVDFAPPVPHAESLAVQSTSTALLYLGWRYPTEGFISAKIFEYMGADRPVLAVGPSGGPISEILRECGVADLSDRPAKIAERLERWIHEFTADGRLRSKTDRSAVNKYTRRAQTERLARLLDRITSGPSNAG